MKQPEEELELHFRPRAKETVSIEIPKDTLVSLKKVADSRDMSYQALLKLYIGQGLRQDLARLFSERVLETTAQVLTRHIQSGEADGVPGEVGITLKPTVWDPIERVLW